MTDRSETPRLPEPGEAIAIAADCGACLDISKRLMFAVSELQAANARVRLLQNAVWSAYKKHHIGDDSIGWDELSTQLQTVLCEVMGDENFQSAMDDIRFIREKRNA